MTPDDVHPWDQSGPYVLGMVAMELGFFRALGKFGGML